MPHKNTGYIDLHLHSSCSDGIFSPGEIVALAAEHGLAAIALADHDTVAGVIPAITAAAGSGVEVIPAVELSVQFKSWSDVHLLGYGIDVTDEVFLSHLNSFRIRREQRNLEILQRVNALLAGSGLSIITPGEVARFARDTIGRPHIARALIERRFASSVEDAFRRYLVPCNVPKQYWPINDAIGEIHRTGGIAVLAHPTSVSTDRQELEDIIRELAAIGLDGIEVFNNMAHADEMEFLRRIAGQEKLLITGGSDFHGIEAGIEPGKGRGGIRFSTALLPAVSTRIRKRRVSSGLCMPCN